MPKQKAKQRRATARSAGATAPAEGHERSARSAGGGGEPPPPAGLSRRHVCILLIIAGAGLGGWLWVGYMRMQLVSPNPVIGRPNYDFFQYYVAGYNWNLGIDPYNDRPEIPGAMLHPLGQRGEPDAYFYPPTFVPAYALLARMSYDTARWLWLVGGWLAFAAAAAIAAFVARGRRLEVVTAAWLLTLFSFPFFYASVQGQIDVVVAACGVSAFLLYPRWGGWPTAALLALAIAAKVTPVLILAVMVLYFRDWRLLLKALACGAVVFFVSLIWVSPSYYREFVTSVMPHISQPDPHFNNQTVLRYFSGSPAVARALSVFGWGVLLAVAYLVGRAGRHADRAGVARLVPAVTERYAVLLLACCFMLFFSPLSWPMGYVWVLIPAAVLLVGAPLGGRVWGPAIVMAGVACMLGLPQKLPLLSAPQMTGAVVAILGLLLFYLPMGVPPASAGDK